MKSIGTLWILFLLAVGLHATDTLYVETFNGNSHTFALNTADVSSVTNGYNDFIVNNAYTGGSGSLICLGFPFNYTISNTANQPAGVIGNPNSFYLHTISDEAVADNIFASSFQAADGVCQVGQNIFSKMDTAVSTLGYQNVTVSFWWACGGGTAIHGEVYYSTNGGTSWTQITSPISQYKNQATWVQQSFSLPAFDGQADLRLGFRFVNQSSTAATDPGFSIDDVVITGDQLIDLRTDSVSVLSFCPGDPVDVFYSAIGSFNAGNVFTAQLSDPNGSFAIPVPIGSVSSSSSGSIAGTIPANAPAGTGYRIRVVSSSPVVTGSDNGTDLSVLALPVAGTLATQQDSVCEGDSTLLQLTGHTGSIQWEGSTDGLNFTPIAGGSSPTLSSGVLFQTTWYQAVVSNACGSQTSNVVQVILAPSAVAGMIMANPDSLCDGESTLLTVSGASGNLQWQQVIGPAFQDIPGATATSYNTGPLAAGASNEFRIKAGFGSCPDVFSTPLSVFVASRPLADFSFVDNGLAVDFTDLSTGATSWAWDFGDSGTSSQQNPSHSYAANGNYTVTLIVENAFGCRDTVTDQVSVMVGRATPVPAGWEIEVAPNPFAEGTGIDLYLPVAQEVRIQVVDLRGRVISLLNQGLLAAGKHHFQWTGEDTPAGLYLLRIWGEGSGQTIRLQKL